MHYLEPNESHRRMLNSSTDPEKLRLRMIERNEQEHDFGTDVEIAKVLLDMDSDDRRAALALLSDDQVRRIMAMIED